MNIFQPVIIFSVFNLDRSYGENKQAHDRVLELLKNNNILYKELEGFYEGASETSILIHDNTENKTLVNQIAMKHNQETILLLDSNRVAMLSNVSSGVITSLGLLLSSKVKPDSLSWTYDRITDMYFFTKIGV